MSRRLLPTLADYVVIAINPALIMGLVGSLVYFLLEVFYGGQYPDRLQFCLSAFVFASVLVSRIAMEDGFQHAAPFGMALAVVVGLVLAQFVDYRGLAVGQFGLLINWGLMALVWWCAHKLTWDCTSIDETEEAAGRGLLETAGIDRASGVSSEDTNLNAGDHTAEAFGPNSDLPPLELPRTGWQRLLDRPATPHTPGVWVIYFSLASLPIFGLGQAFIPPERTASRRYVFVLLCVYVACGLMLLLSTSFLGLRRYLRQRRLEMPLRMVGSWLATGVAMIAVLLLLTAMLPRPAPEFAISEMPWKTDSPQREASSMSMGSEGVRDANAGPDSGVDHSQDKSPDGSEQSGGADTSRGTGKTGAQSGQSGQASGQSSSGSSGSKSDAESKSSAGSGEKSNESSSQQNQNGQPQSGQPEPGGKTEPADGQTPQQQPGPQSSNSRPLPGETQMPPPPAVPSLGALEVLVTSLVKYVFLAAVAVGLLWGAWSNREWLIGTMLEWIEACRAFWRSLFSGRRFDEDAEELERLNASPLWSFSDFVDPFARGNADRHGAAELVKYTFAALEVWGREHDCLRGPDQTPYEFALRLGVIEPAVSDDAKSLAQLYGRAVYSAYSLPMSDVEWLALLWRFMQANPAPQPVAPE